MKRDAQRRTWRAAAATAAVAVLGTLSTAAMAEEAIVKMPAASVLSAKTARSTKLANLKTGDKLQVLAHEGSWLKVSFGGKEGYVHENTVGGGGDNKLSKVLGEAGGASASEATGALAGKGGWETAMDWAKGHGMNTAGLEKMIAVRNSITDADQRKFDADLK
jgi:hypothetical protein